MRCDSFSKQKVMQTGRQADRQTPLSGFGRDCFAFTVGFACLLVVGVVSGVSFFPRIGSVLVHGCV